LSIEWLFTGTQEASNYLEITFNNQIRVVYGKPDGELLGVKVVGEIEGLVYDQNLTLKVEYLIEKEGYEVGEFNITRLIGGTFTEITMVIGVVILGIVLINKRVKKDR